MRGTIFKHPTFIPHYAMVSQKLSDIEIYEIEKQLIEDGWEPIPNYKNSGLLNNEPNN